MNEEMKVGEKYEQQIIEPLKKMEKEGKGKIIELCQLKFDDRTLPFIGFTTGETAVVTAGFCPYAAFGTYETVLKICDRGIEGITSFPTVTPKEYDKIIRNMERAERYLTLVDLIRDLFGLGIYGESDEPATFRMYPIFNQMEWNKTEKSEPTRKIIESIGKSKIIFDLRNGYTLDGSYILVSKPTQNRMQNAVDYAIVDEIESRKYEISEQLLNFYQVKGRKKILYGPQDELCNTAYDLGVLNYVINVPTVTYREKGKIKMTNIQENVETNIAVITRGVKLLV